MRKIQGHTNNIDDLLNRYFQGEINDEEAKVVTEWVKLSPENMEYFRQTSEKWDGGGDNHFAQLNWKLFKNKINRSKELDRALVQRFDRRITWYKITAIAAIFVVFALSSYVFLLLQETNTTLENLVFETPRGHRSKVILRDSTVIWLNAESKLEVKTWNRDNRIVSLNGQAHFKVSHNHKAPFIVKTSNYDVTVLGTVFDVMSYEDEQRTVTTLFDGSVLVSNEKTNLKLHPGEQAIWEDDNLRVLEVNDIARESGWVRNDFNFDNIPLAELLKKLERWYDVDFDYKEEELNELKISGAFKNEETVWQVLNTIKLYIPIKYEKTDLRKIKISRIE
ncbi:MAG: FecR family protein [Carboxylicivirga sp.]|jgi:ferric-dicitrate binding protein FerR (iron transport regulator)|nr:FecR family protein [Carboxylicivirga sp.]MCT4646919.1 FecR family protein [Carboxylicivirga sp.]